uniref:Serpin B6 n=1 Tax=Poecilia latipinna TaxID=48699 RepID=A0A3B3U2U7_9TELE
MSLKASVSLVLVLIHVASILSPGKIKDMVAEGGVDNMTRMVLVNALYFKGDWFMPFSMEKTYKSKFRLNKVVTKPVQMMFQKNYFHHAYISEVRCQVIKQLNGAKKSETEINISIVIITTHFNVVINTQLVSCQLEKHLTYEKFLKWTHPDNMKDSLVEVKLPQFKLEETYDLNKVLSSMGMADAFDIKKSDFSGMSGNKDLFLSSVSHKAFVEVNEKGTEAAASTQMRFRCGSSFLPRINIPISFTADHPFLFFIRHDPTKSILFAGRFCSP